MPAWSMST
uniref:Uncharacterized protein n=1 Tax=Arundo donax TaxID=35708 RepID=A0A0A9BG37_ARUDO